MIPILVLTAAAAMLIVELLRPGRRWPRVRDWWLRAALVSAAQALVVYAAGRSWDPWLRTHRPFDATGLGDVGGAVLGYVVITFVFYWWHRLRHDSDGLWRWVHQLHHSPRRIEVVTSFYKHPVELVLNSVLIGAVLFLVCGLGPRAASGALLLCGLAELFYHWNVRTPRWLGYVVQRPEMHCEHHREGVHRHNYADLPLWDLLFGTFHNPARFEGRCGFGRDERRLVSMLRGRKVA